MNNQIGAAEWTRTTMELPPLAPEASASAISPRPHVKLYRIAGSEFQSLAKSGAEDRNRTGTVVSNRGILSPVRLPVPPPRQIFYGAGDGNRTHVISLEGWSSTIELHPQRNKWSWREELNSQPADYKSAALPIELHQHFLKFLLRTI